MLKARYRLAEARVPSSTANLGPGYDVHSLALQEPYLSVRLERKDSGHFEVRNLGDYGHLVTANPREHAGAKALMALYADRGIEDGFILQVTVQIPPRKGLGLSGAEAAGAIVCAEKMYGLGLAPDEAVHYASKGEPGSHLDNVSASLKGGFNISIRDPETMHPRIHTIKPPKDLGVAVIVPSVQKASTEAARKPVPTSIPREQYIEMISRVAAISAGFAIGNTSLILENIAWDRVVEPARANAGIYGEKVTESALMEEKRHLLKTYHVAETMSGAGPSKALWYSIREDAKVKRKNKIGTIEPSIRYVKENFERLGYTVEKLFQTRPSAHGARAAMVK